MVTIIANLEEALSSSSSIWPLLSSSLIHVIAFSLIIKYLIGKCERDARLVKFGSTLPGPRAFPIIGNAIDFLLAGIDGTQRKFSEYAQKYGEIYRLWIGKHLLVTVADVDQVEALFRCTKTIGKPEIFEPFHEFWGNGLFTAPMSTWRRNRKALQPIFSKNMLKHQLDVFHETAIEFANIMKGHVDGAEFDVYSYYPYLAVDAFSKMYLDLRLDLNEKKYFGFHKILQIVATKGISSMFVPWLRFKSIGTFYYKNGTNFARTRLREFYKKVSEEKLPLLELSESDEQDKNALSPWRSFLSTLLKLEKDSNDTNLMFDEVSILMTAASDTIALTSSFFSLIIAMYPEIQDKLYAEIRLVFGDDDRIPTMDDIYRLTYLDQVLKEVQRRFTLVPTIFREVTEDVKIGSHIFPAGTEIMLRIEDVHMNPNIYPNPSVFNPDNFSAQAVRKRSKFSFIPFSAGTRDCVGRYFADLTVKMTQIVLLRKYIFSTTTKMKDIERSTSGFVSDKTDGYYLSIKLRKP